MRFLSYGTFNLTSTVCALLSGKHDVVITPSPPLTIGLAGWLVARIRGGAFIYNVQDIYPDAAIKLGLLTQPTVIRLLTWMERIVYRAANAVTVISDDFRANLMQKGVPANKIWLIPNAVDGEFLHPMERDNSFAREHGITHNFVVLYAGNVGLAQGVETLVDAACYIRNRNIKVLIVGNGAGLSTARSRAEQRSLTNIRFVPFQPRERVPEVYASADVGVVLLRRGMGTTSTPSKLYSIMAAGKAVVACVDRGSEVWRVVEGAGCGVCVEPEDPVALGAVLDRLSADPSNTRELGLRGRAYVERNHNRARVGDLYHSLIVEMASRKDMVGRAL
jgi:colanic acid biosynthesis glycosyl transferase WcaI